MQNNRSFHTPFLPWGTCRNFMVHMPPSVPFVCAFAGVGVTFSEIPPVGEGLLGVFWTHWTILVGSQQSLSQESLWCDTSSYAQSKTTTIVLPYKFQQICWISLLAIIKAGRVRVMPSSCNISYNCSGKSQLGKQCPQCFCSLGNFSADMNAVLGFELFMK